MDQKTTSEEKIQSYYDNLWSVGKGFGERFIDVGFHFGYYEKGIINEKKAIQNMNRHIGILLGLGDGQSYEVLEAGCGVGATSRYLARQHPECRFTGVSLGMKEIEIAQQIQKKMGLQNIRFLTGNYNKTGFETGSFDRAFALESFVYAVNKKDVCNEIARVLKPGGKFVIIDGFFPKDLPPNSFLNNNYLLLLSKRSLPGIITLQEVESDLKLAGFTDIVIHDLSVNIGLHYIFGGFVGTFRNLVLTEMKQLMRRMKGKASADTDKIIGGAGFIEMLLGITRHLGYYTIVATKR